MALTRDSIKQLGITDEERNSNLTSWRRGRTYKDLTTIITSAEVYGHSEILHYQEWTSVLQMMLDYTIYAYRISDTVMHRY